MDEYRGEARPVANDDTPRADREHGRSRRAVIGHTVIAAAAGAAAALGAGGALAQGARNPGATNSGPTTQGTTNQAAAPATPNNPAPLKNPVSEYPRPPFQALGCWG